MKKFIPHILIFTCLIAGVCYFIYQYSPSTLEKKESEFAVRNIDAVTKVRLTDEKGDQIILEKKNKTWIVNGKYEVNDEKKGMLFTALQKMETMYRTPENGEKYVYKNIKEHYNKCEIFLRDGETPSKTYYVGNPTPDGLGTHMVMELNGQLAPHSYVTCIPGMKVYLTEMYFPDIYHWRSRWIFRDNDADIQSLSVSYHREKQKSLEIRKVAKDSFVIVNSDGQVLEQPKQKFIHQYLGFYEGLSLEAFKNKDTAARDSIVPMEPFCTIRMKRTDSSATSVILYYMPVNEQTRVQFDEEGHKLVYDVEHYYALLNDKKDFAVVQFYTWGKILRSYQDFFIRPEVKPQ